MLTPSKIKNHHFEAAGKNAYRAQSVDDFFEIVADSYEQMFKENGELVKKIGLLAERVEEYRNDEDNIRAALLTAQRMADKIMKETNEKAENQLAEATQNAAAKEASAEAKAKKLLEQAQHDADMLIAETKQKAERMIEDATAEAKEQAVVARDRMIKTQAALDLVEKEADKFKRELLTLYTEHIELINKIPEVEQEQKPEEEKEEPEAVAAEEPAQEPEEKVEEEIVAEPETTDQEDVQEDIIEEPVPEEEETEDIPVAQTPHFESIDETEEQDEQEDEISDSDLERLGIISKSDKDNHDKEDMKGDFAAAFATMKDKVRQPVDADEYEDYSDSEEKKDEDEKEPVKPHGFKFNVDSLKLGNDDEDDDEYYDDEEDDDDELYDDEDEDDDDDDNGNFSSKFKGFFKR